MSDTMNGAGLRSATLARYFWGSAWLVGAALVGVASSGACSSSATKTAAPDGVGGEAAGGVGGEAAGGVGGEAAGGGVAGESGATAAGGQGEAGMGGAATGGAGATGGGAGGADDLESAGASGAAGAGGSNAGPLADFSGAQVEWIARYPTLAGAISTPLSAVVGPGIEFPNVQNAALQGYYLAAADIDVGPASIDIQLNQAVTVPQAAFNGYELSFASSATSGNALPVIKSVSINAATSADLAQAQLTFSDNAVYVNFVGLSYTTSSRLLIDIGF